MTKVDNFTIPERTSNLTEEEVEDLSSRKTRKHVRDVLQALGLDNSFSVEEKYFPGGTSKVVTVKDWKLPEDESPAMDADQDVDSNKGGLAEQVEETIKSELGIIVSFKPANNQVFISA
jgi:hypothetical protein